MDTRIKRLLTVTFEDVNIARPFRHFNILKLYDTLLLFLHRANWTYLVMACASISFVLCWTKNVVANAEKMHGNNHRSQHVDQNVRTIWFIAFLMFTAVLCKCYVQLKNRTRNVNFIKKNYMRYTIQKYLSLVKVCFTLKYIDE